MPEKQVEIFFKTQEKNPEGQKQGEKIPNARKTFWELKTS